MYLNDLHASNYQIQSPVAEQRLLYQEAFGQIRLKQIHSQSKLKDLLLKAIMKLRKYTKIKNIDLLSKHQLLAFNDVSSCHNTFVKKEKETTQFEKQYYQYKQQNLSLQLIVTNLMNMVRMQGLRSIKASHPLLIFWSFLKFLLVLHLCFIFPLSDSFIQQLDEFIQIQQPIFFIEIVILAVDIIMRLNVQIYNKGTVITQTKQIIVQYFRKEFLIDFGGLLGLLAFLFSQFTPLKYLFVLKIKELSNFMEVFKYEIDPKGKFKSHLKLMTLLITVVLLAHCFACVWIGVGQHSLNNNWIVLRDLQNAHWLEIYVNGLYFAITTMTTVGYGDITPINPYEVSVSICLTLFSSCIFAYVFNTITSILKDLDANKSKIKHDLEILSLYMKKRNIDSDLQKRVENYLRLVYKHQPSIQEKKIFNKLSPQLRQELNEQDKGVMLLKQPALVNNFSLKFLRDLIESIQEINLTPNEQLPNDQGLNILQKGELKLFFGEHQTLVGYLKPGDGIGVKSLFNGQNQSTRLSCKSEGFSQVYQISQNDFFKKLKDADLDQYYQIKDKIMQNNYDNLYEKCLLCRKFGHEICEDIYFNLNKELILAKYRHSVNQERKIGYNRKRKHKYRVFQALAIKRQSATQCYQKSMKFMKMSQKQNEENDEISESYKSDSYDELEEQRHFLDEQKDNITVFIDRENSMKDINKEERKIVRSKVKGPSLVRMLQNFSSLKVWQDDFFILGDFDKMKCFRMYYPTHNFDQVIKYYNQKRKRINKTLLKVQQR
ncbi:unnamed protein product (macronuclear) [Paramecium tetraurelia]|uniref:Potassium channel domain-containing protein n=1 Tax=Paramecium tetraurelia TaxID=5888 RepID=A0DHY4_PARTE|nr:uncharacterized protein GSPATT00017022001 [Paramecium tetraurelia]CAK82651.1 unnamed protein product [Paramecium tetraurelia]|eukprot:XP_001450048.1 hypothetical protein (macronuclear) [Paramecium tetraurelia strain d4-2]